jgi:hypothetical protein
MPTDREIVTDTPGKCPKCGMKLEPARLKQGYACVKHDAILREHPGICPLDRRELVGVTVNVFWTCRGEPSNKLTDPGKCADGTDRLRRIEKQPHADHNPRHGGLFYMADTGLHHVEGTLPEAGLFRVYFYDEATKPMSALGFTARAIVTDPKGVELEIVPLKPGRLSNTLEGQLKTRTFPVHVTMRIRFKADDKERPFTFPFVALTKEP